MAKYKSNTKGKEGTVGKKAKPKSSILPTSPYFYLAICLVITLICYLPAFYNEWTNWDDQGYVYENDMTKNLSFSTLWQFLSTYQMGNYHPLPMLSLGIDYKLFKMHAGWYHFHSIVLHLINVALVFFFVWTLNRKIWASVITALFFAIHPAHIESVAWISERKDLLYVLYYMAALITYLKYIKAPTRPFYYVLTIIFFLLSLLSKGQAVTFSVVLLLIDYYIRRPFNARLVIEKIPFFVLSILFGVIAIYAQKNASAINDIKYYDMLDKAIFSGNSFVTYFYKALLPLKLSAFYPYPLIVDGHYPWIIKVTPAFTLVMAGLVIYSMTKGRLVAFGFAFFFVNVILLLQILPVGGAMMADRYTYLAYIGLFFIMGMGVQWVIDNSTPLAEGLKLPVILVTLGFTVFFGYKTYSRNYVWKNSETLYLDMLANYSYIPVANNNLGNYYQKHDKIDLALKYFTDAIDLQSDYKEARINRSDIYRQKGKIDSAISDCTHVLEIDKDYPGAYMNRGIAYSIKGRYDSAMSDFRNVLKQEPDNARAYGNLGNLYDMKAQYDSAIACYNKALKLDPDYTDVYGNRGRSNMKKGDIDESIKDLNMAIEIDPNNPENYALRADAYNTKGDYKQALSDALIAQSKGQQINAPFIEMLKGKVKSK